MDKIITIMIGLLLTSTLYMATSIVTELPSKQQIKQILED